MDYTPLCLKNTFCLLDDTIVLTKGSKEDNFNLDTDCFTKADADNLRMKLTKNHLTKTRNFCLDYNIT